MTPWPLKHIVLLDPLLSVQFSGSNCGGSMSLHHRWPEGLRPISANFLMVLSVPRASLCDCRLNGSCFAFGEDLSIGYQSVTGGLEYEDGPHGSDTDVWDNEAASDFHTDLGRAPCPMFCIALMH